MCKILIYLNYLSCLRAIPLDCNLTTYTHTPKNQRCLWLNMAQCSLVALEWPDVLDNQETWRLKLSKKNPEKNKDSEASVSTFFFFYKLINCSGRVSDVEKEEIYSFDLRERKHNKSAAGLKGRMTRMFFSLFTVLTAYFIVYLLSPLSYPASANPSPLRIHKASYHLFTRFLTAFFFFFFFLPQRRISELENSAGTLQSFTFQEGDTWKPHPLSVLRRDQEELVCPFVSSLSLLPPSSLPFLLSFSPGRREADRYQHV